MKADDGKIENRKKRSVPETGNRKLPESLWEQWELWEIPGKKELTVWSSMGTLLVAGKASQRCTQLLIDWLRLAAHRSREGERRGERERDRQRERDGEKDQLHSTAVVIARQFIKGEACHFCASKLNSHLWLSQYLGLRIHKVVFICKDYSD